MDISIDQKKVLIMKEKTKRWNCSETKVTEEFKIFFEDIKYIRYKMWGEADDIFKRDPAFKKVKNEIIIEFKNNENLSLSYDYEDAEECKGDFEKIYKLWYEYKSN